MDNKAKVSVNGVNALSLLGVLFVGLKLTGHITWPWVWVLAPFWMPLAVVIVLAVIAAIVYAFVSSQSGK